MKKASDKPDVLFWAEDYQTKKFINIFKTNNRHFEIIQQTLYMFLEKKREVFTRFYFLSNDELLDILSTVKNTIDL